MALTFDQMALAQMAYVVIAALQGLVTFGSWRFGALQYQRRRAVWGAFLILFTFWGGLWTLNTLIAAVTLTRGGFRAGLVVPPGGDLIITGTGEQIGYQLGTVIGVGLFLGVPFGLAYLCARATIGQEKRGHRGRAAALSIATVLLGLLGAIIGWALLRVL